MEYCVLCDKLKPYQFSLINLHTYSIFGLHIIKPDIRPKVKKAATMMIADGYICKFNIPQVSVHVYINMYGLTYFITTML